MDVTALETFLAVARSGSFSAAAERLHCVQSNVSTRVKHLEADLGVDLFHRGRRGVVPTAAGKVLTSYAERVLDLVDETARAVRGTLDAGGPLRVGSLETTAAVRLPPVLIDYGRALPEVDLSLVTGDTATLIRQVLAHELDGAFISGEIAQAELDCRTLFVEELVLVEAAGGADRPQVLLAFRTGCTYRSRAEQWLAGQGALGFRVMEFGSLDAILGCAAAGFGVSLLPRSVVDRAQYRGQLRTRDLPPALAQVPTCFVRRRDRSLHRPLARLVEMAAQMNDKGNAG